jgi:hypothetical protein
MAWERHGMCDLALIVPLQSCEKLCPEQSEHCNVVIFFSLAEESDWFEQPKVRDNPCHLGPAPRDPLEVAAKQTTAVGSLRTAHPVARPFTVGFHPSFTRRAQISV